MKALSNSDLEDEQAAVDTLETKKKDRKVSAKEHEADARPQKAGDYRKPWDAFRAACRLFKDELNALDKSSRDAADKSTFGKRTRTAHVWFEGLPKEKKREAELATDKWNREGAPKQSHLL